MHFHVERLPPFDGDHPLDLERFNNRELHLIKEVSKVRVQEIEEAFAAGDNDLLVAFAMIAIQRSWGRQLTKQEKDRIWDADVGAIQLVADEQEEDEPEDDADPPAPQKTEPEQNVNADAPADSSGSSSNGAGDSPEPTPLRTGDPSSDIGSPV